MWSTRIVTTQYLSAVFHRDSKAATFHSDRVKEHLFTFTSDGLENKKLIVLCWCENAVNIGKAACATISSVHYAISCTVAGGKAPTIGCFYLYRQCKLPCNSRNRPFKLPGYDKHHTCRPCLPYSARYLFPHPSLGDI
ncbi:hypothetical protein EV356DRAFT_204258 [Viridothelium virens]|uniref:Uncharacterized protein n=1 Tax=Viridothelium virens TaxID=1048519 RepID=A0A6A6H6K1_VIRVR|nr:hypothetical protein EV356DRAFT_204258 [Viridothelium virens]